LFLDEMLKIALEEGFVPIFQNGIAKAVEGVTSIEEILKVAKG